MARKNVIVSALVKRSSERLSKNQLWNTIEEFDNQNLGAESQDRACALVLGAIVEQGLETAISSHLISQDQNDLQRLFGGGFDGDTSINFASKIRLGFALGVFGKETRDDLGIIRHIRNTFAHSQVMISFSNLEISDACKSLHFLTRAESIPYLVGRKADPKSILIAAVRTFFAYFSDVRDGAPIKWTDHEWGHIFP